MLVKAKLRYLRIAPRKVRMVAELIRRKSVVEAESILRFTVKKPAKPFLKLLNSAVANAKSGFQMDKENLYIQKVLVDEGPKMKRWLPRARGKADEIQKKTSHITLFLDEISEKPKRAEKKEVSETKMKEKLTRKRLKTKKRIKRPEKIFSPKGEMAKQKIFRRKTF